MITQCHYCGRDIVQNRKSGYRHIYCDQVCRVGAVRNKSNRGIKPEIYSPPLDVNKVFYPMPDNRIYSQQMSEVQGLSRLYLDGEVNLDTLRILEIETEKRIRQRYHEEIL